MFWGKIFRTKQDVVVAICDEKLLGKKLAFNGMKVSVSKNFYGEKLIDGRDAVNAMRLASIGNLLGKEIIELARENGFIDKQNIILINEIPHAQFVKL